MRAKIGCAAAVLVAAFQMGCGKQAPPPPRADTTSAPPPGTAMRAEAPPAGMRVPTQQEYDSIQAAWRKQGRNLPTGRKTRADSTGR